MRRRAAVAAGALVAWVAGSVLGTVAPAPPAAAAPLLQIAKAHAGYTPSLTGNKPVFVLAIGSGARQGEDVVHSLADSIHVIAINPAKHGATVIGIPRDSWVEIPGYGASKINATMVFGGPPLLVQTVESLMGIKIAYYALTTFWGMTYLINGIGGLVVDVPCPMQDSFSRANFRPGSQRLDGSEVLAFSRDRHSFLSGDFARSENGGLVFLSALAQFRKEFAKDPSSLFTWLSSGLRNIQTDVPLSELMLLAFTSYQIKTKDVHNIVLPGSTGMQGSESVVYISSSAQSIFRDVRTDGILGPKDVPASPSEGC